MDNVIDSFSQIEYLINFTAIIIGFIAAEFFLGWGFIVRNRERVVVYWLHLQWWVIMFVVLLDWWWEVWIRIGSINDNIGFYAYNFISALIFYLIANELSPRHRSFKGKMIFLKLYYYSKRARLFSLITILLLSFVVDTVLFLNMSFFHPDNILKLVAASVCLSLALIRKPAYHYAIVVVVWGLLLGYVLFFRV